ncbi:hypothetical protein Poly51_63910 [Rubripirellula tenax]|uniref:Ice-binding protein C-terminal domain-containing protein n=2 Tax=Rubripirellula tenax TaxID=2528015 RepID=A0A5C6DZP5_9BACT|nr:hypothetical protein Poly51_63910 [Rubripirellula tenax]
MRLAGYLVILQLCFATAASADLIVSYRPTGGFGSTASSTGTGVTGLDLARGPGIDATTFSNGFYAASQWTTSSSLDLDDYFQWGFTSTNAFDLTTLDLAYSRDSNGPKQIDVQFSTDGVSFSSVFDDASVVDFGEANRNIDISAFTNVTSGTFRLYGFDAAETFGKFALLDVLGGGNSIIVNGNLTAVPEPSSLLLVATCGSLFAFRRRRPVQLTRK